MRILRILAGIVAVGLVAAGAARAGAGEKPHIERTDALDNCYQGTTMTVSGGGFGADAKAVKVILGSDTIEAISVSAAEVVFTVPIKASVGRRQLAVEVGGTKSNSLDVEVQDRAKKPKRDDRGNMTAAGTTIRLDLPTVQADRGVFQISVVGKADYPDGSAIFISLKPSSSDDKRTLMHTDGNVKDGLLHAILDLRGRALFPANYLIEAEFSLDKQPGAVREAFRKAFPKPDDAAAHEHGRDSKSLRVGDPDSGAQEIHEHFATTLRKARALTDDLEDAFASAGRSLFRGKDGKCDEVAWEAWLQEWPYQKMDATMFRNRTAQVRKSLRFLAGNGTLDAEGWRGWMDGAWRTDGLLALAHDHAAFAHRYQFSPCDDASDKLAALLADLNRLSLARTRAIYEGNHLEVPLDAESAKDPVLQKGGAGPVSRLIIEKKVHEVAAAVGLDDKLEVIPPLK